MNAVTKRFLICRLSTTVIAMCLLILAGCAATTDLISTWSDDSYRNRAIMDNVLVIAIVKDQDARKLYEDKFVEKLEALGVHARSSHTLAQPDIKPQREAVVAAVEEAGARSVFITNHLGTETKKKYIPPKPTGVYEDTQEMDLYGFYPYVYREVYAPGYYTDVTTVTLESRLYDAQTAKLVWSAQSESVNPEVNKRYIQELVDIFTDDLKGKELL